MKYSTPELVVLGPAAVLVLGDIEGHLDNMVTFKTQPSVGIALGLDD
jgi:hypothetical protein